MLAEATQKAFENINIGGAVSLWVPDPRNQPQVAAYECKAFELLYGGGVGGGKTDIILGKARNKHKNALILRRTFPEVKRTLVKRSLEFFGDHKNYNASQYSWHIDGRTIEFGHVDNTGTSLESPGDAQKYAGPRYDYIGFDQLEQFPEHVYEFMLTRAGTTIAGQAVQVVSTANPVGDGVQWIMKRWAPWLDETYPNPAAPGEIRYFKRGSDNREIETTASDPDAVGRTFIPAKLKDNPYLGDEYRRSINLLREPMRSALLEGDWKAMITDDAYQVIPRAWVKLAMERWRNMPAPTTPITAVGADASRGGNCKTVLAPRHDNWYAPLRKYEGSEVKDGQAFLAMLVGLPIGDAPINIDVIGVGSSPFDFAKEKYNAVPINVSEKADETATDRSKKFKFANKRAQYVWKFSEALDPKYGDDLALPDDPELLGDLCSYRFEIANGKIKLEDKDDTSKRLGRSPDCGEAVILADARKPSGKYEKLW